MKDQVTDIGPTRRHRWRARRRNLTVAICLLACSCAAARQADQLTVEQQTLYAMGWKLGQEARPYQLTADEIEVVTSGLKDALSNRPARLDLTASEPHIVAFEAARLHTLAEPERQASAAFLDEQARRPGAVRTAEGLVFEPIRKGEGRQLSATDTATIRYRITTRDGSLVNESGEIPVTMHVSDASPCLSAGLQRMRVGEKSRFVCPAQLAYGDRGAPPGVPGGAALVVSAELIAIGRPVSAVGH